MESTGNPNKNESNRDSIVARGLPWILLGLGMFAVGTSFVLKHDFGNPLWYFVAAALCTRLPDLTKFKGGGIEAELAARVEEVKKASDRATLEAAQALATAKTTQGELLDTGEPEPERGNTGSTEASDLHRSELPIQATSPSHEAHAPLEGRPSTDTFYRRLRNLRPPFQNKFDAWKGIALEEGQALTVGDRCESNTRKLQVHVQPDPDGPTFFLVTMRVVATDNAPPLIHPVAFLLPIEFSKQKVVVTPANGEAVLKRRVVRAFTLGALTDTLDILEYDLSKDSNSPEAFRTA